MSHKVQKKARDHLYAANHFPNPNTVACGIAVGLLLARKFRNLPTIQQIRHEFECSQATAYRWRAAMRFAGWVEA